RMRIRAKKPRYFRELDEGRRATQPAGCVLGMPGNNAFRIAPSTARGGAGGACQRVASCDQPRLAAAGVRSIPAFSFGGGGMGGDGMMVMVQRGGSLASISCTARTSPVTIAPPDFTVAGLPLNCAMRKRRTSFWLAVSYLNMERSCALVPRRSEVPEAIGRGR